MPPRWRCVGILPTNVAVCGNRESDGSPGPFTIPPNADTAQRQFDLQGVSRYQPRPAVPHQNRRSVHRGGLGATRPEQSYLDDGATALRHAETALPTGCSQGAPVAREASSFGPGARCGCWVAPSSRRRRASGGSPIRAVASGLSPNRARATGTKIVRSRTIGQNCLAHVTPALRRRIRSQRHSTGSHWLDRAEAKSLSMIFIVVMAVSIGQVGTESPSR